MKKISHALLALALILGANSATADPSKELGDLLIAGDPSKELGDLLIA